MLRPPAGKPLARWRDAAEAYQRLPMSRLTRDEVLEGVIESMGLVIEQPVHAVDAKAVAAAVASLATLMLTTEVPIEGGGTPLPLCTNER